MVLYIRKLVMTRPPSAGRVSEMSQKPPWRIRIGNVETDRRPGRIETGAQRLGRHGDRAGYYDSLYALMCGALAFVNRAGQETAIDMHDIHTPFLRSLTSRNEGF
jgi:hypothetical protein